MKTKIKSFCVRNGSVTFGDPCYDTNKSVKAQNGEWVAHVTLSDEGSWGARVKRLTVHRENFNPADPRLSVKTKTFSVDSGQAGVFASDYYDFKSYDDCCDATLSKKSWGYVAGGAVSSSGFGDGCYDAEIHLLDGVAVCVDLVFIED